MWLFGGPGFGDCLRACYLSHSSSLLLQFLDLWAAGDKGANEATVFVPEGTWLFLSASPSTLLADGKEQQCIVEMGVGVTFSIF